MATAFLSIRPQLLFLGSVNIPVTFDRYAPRTTPPFVAWPVIVVTALVFNLEMSYITRLFSTAKEIGGLGDRSCRAQ